MQGYASHTTRYYIRKKNNFVIIRKENYVVNLCLSQNNEALKFNKELSVDRCVNMFTQGESAVSCFNENFVRIIIHRIVIRGFLHF